MPKPLENLTIECTANEKFYVWDSTSDNGLGNIISSFFDNEEDAIRERNDIIKLIEIERTKIDLQL